MKFEEVTFRQLFPEEVVHKKEKYTFIYNKVTLLVSVYYGDGYDFFLFETSRYAANQYLNDEMRELVEEVFIEHQGE